MHWFANFNGNMVVNCSELLVLIPYLLRSLRLNKIFHAREVYCLTGKIPKRMIEKWAERRVIKYFLVFVIISFLLLNILPLMTV